jgi:hypothetical protein
MSKKIVLVFIFCGLLYSRDSNEECFKSISPYQPYGYLNWSTCFAYLVSKGSLFLAIKIAKANYYYGFGRNLERSNVKLMLPIISSILYRIYLNKGLFESYYEYGVRIIDWNLVKIVHTATSVEEFYKSIDEYYIESMHSRVKAFIDLQKQIKNIDDALRCFNIILSQDHSSDKKLKNDCNKKIIEVKDIRSSIIRSISWLRQDPRWEARMMVYESEEANKLIKARW